MREIFSDMNLRKNFGDLIEMILKSKYHDNTTRYGITKLFKHELEFELSGYENCRYKNRQISV